MRSVNAPAGVSRLKMHFSRAGPECSTTSRLKCRTSQSRAFMYLICFLPSKQSCKKKAPLLRIFQASRCIIEKKKHVQDSLQRVQRGVFFVCVCVWGSCIFGLRPTFPLLPRERKKRGRDGADEERVRALEEEERRTGSDSLP